MVCTQYIDKLSEYLNKGYKIIGDDLMNSLKMMCIFALIIFPLFIVGCGDDEDVISPPKSETQQPVDTKKDTPNPELSIPAPFKDAIEALKQGMEEKNVNLYLDAFWNDEYWYQSDLGTDDIADDVTFDNINWEQESIQRLFSTYDGISVEFSKIEINDDAETVTVKGHHKLLASVAKGKSLPGGYQKVFAEGDSIFYFKKLGNKWRIYKWEQEEMSKDEINKAYADLNMRPPEGALIQTWGGLKAR